LEVFEDWTKSLDKGYGIDVIIYLDYKKAFDTEPHQRILQKLQLFGFSGDVLRWIESFLTGRTMRVVVNGSSSSWMKVLSGVTQGLCSVTTSFPALRQRPARLDKDQYSYLR